ncbi:MAG TPA: DUF4440 domain-containing protein [Acidimicrobiales bacterium]|nr:DUF4440 domain-containing protein [Acidimicrobiales bacterium]
MTVTLDHTIVHARDNLASARLLAEILGMAGPDRPGHFAPVVTGNHVILEFMAVADVLPHHYAFTVSGAEFDAAYERVRARGLMIWGRPDRSEEGQMYEHDGRRGFYFDDPDHNLMELIETPTGVVDDEIHKLAGRWALAEVAGDAGALDELLDDGFVGVGPLGFVLDKAAWRNRFAGGLHNAALSFQDLQVRAHGNDAVVVVGVLDQQTTYNGVDTGGRYRITFVAVRADSGWRIAACHIGPLDPRAGATRASRDPGS